MKMVDSEVLLCTYFTFLYLYKYELERISNTNDAKTHQNSLLKNARLIHPRDSESCVNLKSKIECVFKL